MVAKPKSPEFNPIRGAPPSIEWIKVEDLQVDLTYQRSAEASDSQRIIKAIALDWDWRLCAPLTVSRRTEPRGFYVIDGQHRLEAARRRGDIDYLPCIISTFDTLAEEAGCFVAVNTRRKQVSTLDTFRAALAAEDEKAVLIHAVITGAGLVLAKHTNTASWKPREYSAVQGIRGAIFRHGEAVARAAIGDVAHAFRGEPLRYAATIANALFTLHATPPAGFDAARFRSEVLPSKRQLGWVNEALKRQARYGEMRDSAMLWVLTDAWSSHAASRQAA